MAGSSSPESFIRQHLESSAALALRTATECTPDILAACEMLVASFGGGGKALLCGNGGSAADCQHFAAELVNLLDRGRPRPALTAIALTTDSSLLTAVANDVGFERVFERQVEALGRAGDVLIAISTTGDSPNVLRALERAGQAGLRTILMSGERGGQARSRAELAILVPSSDTQHIQETHIAIGHVLCSLVEQTLFTTRTPA